MASESKTHRGVCRVKVLVFPGSVLSDEPALQAEFNGKEMTLKRQGDVLLNEHPGVWPVDTTRTLFVSDHIEVYGDEFTLLIAPVQAHARKITSPEMIHRAWTPRHRAGKKSPDAATGDWDFRSSELPAGYVNWFTALENFRFTMENLRRMVSCAVVVKGDANVDESVPDPTIAGKNCLVIGGVNTPVTILLELC